MKITKSIEIKKPSQEVFDYLKYTRNQDNFSVWNMNDPDMQKFYTGNDGEVGFIYRWESQVKNVGAGEQETTAINPGKQIDTNVRFFRPMKNVANISFLVEDAGNDVSRVTWFFDSPSRFPFNLLAPLFKNMLGKDLVKGLENLKVILEK